jgi:hypothetical protein
MFVDDQFRDRIAVESGEPHVAIGRGLALSYAALINDPLPERMLALLVQLDEAPEDFATEETRRR